jgi:NADH-quinone oxidoreductase subunit N
MNTYTALYPILTIVTGALLIILLEVFLKKEKKDYLGFIAVLFLLASGAECIKFWNKDFSYFEGTLLLDKFALFFFLILILAVIFITLISLKYLSLQNDDHGEYYSLLLFALSGMMIMVSSRDFLVIFLGLEVLSMASYALAGLKKNDERSSEAAIKYFLLGSFASAFLVFGIALLYGAVFSTDISTIMNFFNSETSLSLMALTGMAFIIIGFGFKIAVVPFHMWTPDVYQGSPTPVTAFFSVGPKAAGFAVLMRIFFPFWKEAINSEIFFHILWILSVLTMVVGNLVALRQKNVKRILAYSSIAHAGYILIAILANDNSGLLFYLTVYLFMNIGAFSAVIALSRKGKEFLELEDYSGIGFRYPWIGATLTVFLFSLAGFPPTGGFLAKFYIFSAAVHKGLVPLVIIGVLASLISVFYYLRIIIYMYMREPTRNVEIFAYNPALFLVLFLCLYGVLMMGIFPGNILIYIKQAVAALAF